MHLRGVSAAAIAFLATAAVHTGTPARAAPPRTVLTIHWGAEDFPGTAILDAAIRAALPSSPDALLDYFYFAEYLESETFPPSAPLLRDYIRQKYKGRRIDVVVASTTAVLEFALAYRDELFPGVPIVFGAGSMPAAFLDRSVPEMTGILSDAAFGATLELALRLQPSVKRVFVVAEAKGSDEYRERIQGALREFSQRVELTYIKEGSLPGLLAAIKAIPPGSVILYTRYTPQEAGGAVHPVEVARLMAQTSPVPIYSAAGLYMGTGVLGGVMRDTRATGTRLGQMARQILDGARPQDIPIENARSWPSFDWRQVQRWGIDPSRLPPESILYFRTPTAWESNRQYIIGIIIVVAAQLLLIAGLLTQRARRRRAEEAIRASEATLRTSYERTRQLAGRIIHAQEAARAGIARDLHDDLCQQLVCVSMGVDSLKHSSGHLQDPKTQRALTDLERDMLRVFDGVRRLSHDLHPASLRLLGLGPALQAHCLEVEKRHDVRVSFTIEPDLEGLSPDVAVCLFRIAQESLRNGLNHGHARRFAVSIARSGDDVELTVRDDGRGFDLEAVRRNGRGLGLVSMEERAHAISGSVHVVTSPGQGTTIRARGRADRASAPSDEAPSLVETR